MFHTCGIHLRYYLRISTLTPNFPMENTRTCSPVAAARHECFQRKDTELQVKKKRNEEYGGTTPKDLKIFLKN